MIKGNYWNNKWNKFQLILGTKVIGQSWAAEKTIEGKIRIVKEKTYNTPQHICEKHSAFKENKIPCVKSGLKLYYSNTTSVDMSRRFANRPHSIFFIKFKTQISNQKWERSAVTDNQQTASNNHTFLKLNLYICKFYGIFSVIFSCPINVNPLVFENVLNVY